MTLFANLPARQRTAALAVTFPALVVAWFLLIAYIVDIVIPTVLVAAAIYIVYRGVKTPMVTWEHHAARVAVSLLWFFGSAKLGLDGLYVLVGLIVLVLALWILVPFGSTKKETHGGF